MVGYMYFELFIPFITLFIILLSLDVFGFDASSGSSSLKFKASVYSACAFLAEAVVVVVVVVVGRAVDVEGCGSILFVNFNKLLYIRRELATGYA